MAKIVNEKWVIITIIAIIIYSIVWSIISIDKYYALNASVYDLGFSMQSLWFVTHEIKTPYDFFSLFISKGILYTLFPLYFVMKAQLLLVLQSMALGMGALPIYGIALSKLKSKKISFALSMFYLLYFPMAGINWFDFHYQMFFIILFLSGYYFYTKGRFGISVIIFGLSGLVRYPYYIFPLAFSFLIILQQIIHKYKNKSSELNRQFPYMILLFLFGSFLFVAQLFILRGVSGLSSDVASGGIIFNYKSITNGSVTFLYLLFPLLFLPLFSKKWVIFMLPFAFLVFTTNSFGYSFPYIFQDQYTSAIVPFIWLGFIDVLSEIQTRQGPGKLLPKHFNLPLMKKEMRINSFILLLVAVLIVSSAIVFEPYGPLNSYSAVNFHTSSELNINESQLVALNSIMNLVPAGNPFVYVQNNLPQAMYGHFSQNILSLYVPNASISNISSNNFPYYYGGSTPIDYVIGDVNNYNFYTGVPSMMQFAQKLFESGYYKLTAASNGIFLLSRIPRQNSTYFKNYNITIKPPSPLAWAVLNASEGNLSSINDITLYQKYSDYLLPGIYSVTTYLYSPNNISSVNLTFQFDNNYGNILSEEQFSFSDLKSGDITKFVMNLTVGDFFSGMSINTWGNGSEGYLYIKGISLSYIDPITTFIPIQQLDSFYNFESNTSIISISNGGIFYHENPSFSGSVYWNIITLNEKKIIFPKFITISNGLTLKKSIQSYLENLSDKYGYAMVYSNTLYKILEKDVPRNSTDTKALILIPAYSFNHYGYVFEKNNELMVDNLTSNETGWFGPNLLLFPGNYTISFLLSYKDGKGNDRLDLDVYYPNFYGLPHNIIINSTVVHYNGKLSGPIFSISLNFTLIHTESYVQFRAMNIQWYGDLTLHGAILKEL